MSWLGAAVVLSHAMERSVLQDARARKLQRYDVGGRKRHATCSGVAWFSGHHLAVVNLYGEHLRIYRFRENDPTRHVGARIELLHELRDGLAYPEDVAVSADGKWLAITHSMSEQHGLSLHAMDPGSFAPHGPARMLDRGNGFHGVSFSPDSRHLAHTRIGESSRVVITRIADGVRTCLLNDLHAPLKPKSLAFSRDGRFAVVACARNIEVHAAAERAGGALSVHGFDMASGVLSQEPLVALHGSGDALANIEICTFLPTAPGTPYRVLAANQGRDLISAFELDAQGRTLRFVGIFAAGLAFPHGLDASADGKLIAVTNYGDDTLRIARVKHPDASPT